MRVFQRIATREQFSTEREWCKGYAFVACDVSDVVICESSDDLTDIGRMHLRSAVREIPKSDPLYFSVISEYMAQKMSIAEKTAKKMKKSKIAA